MNTTTISTTDRAGDHDRQQAASLPGEAFAQGFLQLDEYEERVQRACQVHSTQELKQLRAARQAALRRATRIHLFAYLAVAAIVLMFWAAATATTGAIYFWPMWPIFGGAIGLFTHGVAVANN